MIEINGIEYYTAKEITEELELKYSSVIAVLRKYNFPKFKRSYIVTRKEIEELKKRKQTRKMISFDEDYNYSLL